MKYKKQRLSYLLVLLFTLLFYGFSPQLPPASAAKNAETRITEPVFVFLSCADLTIQIHEEYRITGFSTNGKLPKFRSSNSKIVSVNAYGLITGKRAGTARITATVGKSSASCRVMVEKTIITVDPERIVLERGDTKQLKAAVSNQSEVHWKSSKKATASVDENGFLTAGRPGKAIITAKADQSEAKIYVTVKKPDIRLTERRCKLYRGQTFQLEAEVSSGITPSFRSNKKSVATVDEAGKITAIKHGKARITVTADGSSCTFELTVVSPEIRLNVYDLTLKKGESKLLVAKVSSGNTPAWKSSNPDVVSVTPDGIVTARQKGRAYIYATEDGAKERCAIKVTG